VQAGQMFAFVAQSTSGMSLHEMIKDTPVAPYVASASARFQQAIEMYERIGDRRGLMSSVIGMAYLAWGPDIHIGSGAARHIEEIRRVSSRLDTITKESERVQAEEQMLYGVHVFARAKVIPDLALARGEELYRHARAAGDRWLEFLAAGGTAMAHVALGDVEQAEGWVDRASAAAAES